MPAYPLTVEDPPPQLYFVPSTYAWRDYSTPYLPPCETCHDFILSMFNPLPRYQSKARYGACITSLNCGGTPLRLHPGLRIPYLQCAVSPSRVPLTTSPPQA